MTRVAVLLVTIMLCSLVMVGPVNAAMGDVVLSFNAKANNSTGLTWIDGYLWNIAHGHDVPAKLHKLDPSDGTILLTFTLSIEHVMGLTWDGNAFWAVSHEDSVIYQLNAIDGSIIKSFPSPNPGTIETGCEGMAWDGQYLWYADSDLDMIFQLDPVNGAEISSFPSPGSKPLGLAWDGMYLWHFDQISNMVYQLDSTDGSVQITFPAPGSGQGDLAFDGQYLWLSRNGADTIYKIDIGILPPVAEAGPDQTVNEGEIVHFKGCRSYDPDGMYVHYNFDTSDEGFVKETNYPLSDVHWDTTNGNVYFKADNSDPGDEIFTKPLDFSIDENSGSWNLSARTMITDPGVWQDPYLLFLADSSITEIVNSPNTISFEYFSATEGPGSDPPLRARYIDSTGIRRILLFCPSSVNTEYILRASYNYGCRNVTMQILDENEVVLSEGSYIIGTNPSDGFTFGKIGVGTDGYSGAPYPVSEGWTDDIGFKYYSLKYEWDFDAAVDSDGDGNFTNDVDATGPTPTHIYGDDGVYTVTLTVIDSQNLSATDICIVTVNNVAPSIDSFGPFTIEGGVPLIIDASANDPGSDDLCFTWDWGDGTAPKATTYYNDGIGPEPTYDPVTNEIKSPWGVFPFSVTDNLQHTYNDTGVYTITLTVEDDDGDVTILITNVTVFIVIPPTLYINVSQNREDIILNWSLPSTFGISHYLIYRSISQTDFDFDSVWVNTSEDKESGELNPIPLRTKWNDTNAAFPGNDTNYEEQYYYTIRAVYILGKMSSTSRTVGKWTKTFPQEVSTFSLPLEPLETMNTTIDYYLNDMDAEYIKWMDPVNHIWMKHGEGDVNDTQLEVGKGYEVNFGNQTNYTFTGMPGAMIMYDDGTEFLGFDPDTNAKNLTATVNPLTGNITLNWTKPSCMDAMDQYYLLRSTTRDGFWTGNYIQLANLSLNVLSYIDIGNATVGTQYYYMILPVNKTGVKGASTYSLGVWTANCSEQYDTIGIPLKIINNETADWYCDNIQNTVGINYYNVSAQRWCWHSTRMIEGAYDPLLVMSEGYQISTLNTTKYTFIGR